MYAKVEKPKENKSRAIANSVPNKNHVKQGFGFVDNRPETNQLRKLNNIIKHGTHSKQNVEGGTVQRVCYSVNNGGHGGNTQPGAPFTNKEDYFAETNTDLDFTASHTGIDAITGETLVPHELLMPVIGHVDHIVPANLGGGPVASNGRLIDARTNTSRRDNFNTAPGPWTVNDIVIVADNKHGYTTAAGARNNGGATPAELRALHDAYPAIWGPTKRFKTTQIGD